MLDILSRSIARAGGIEVADHIRIVPRPKPGKSILRRLTEAFRRERTRHSVIKVLSRLDDRSLNDIGLPRRMLPEAADRFSRLQAANDNLDIPRSAA